MSNWCWRVIAIKVAFIIVFFVSYLRADETVHKLPFCNPESTNSNNAAGTNDLVIVSTLDGKITAFITANGVKAWDLQTQPLLSSNLHHVELTSGGKWVRLVPSLRGTLYSVSGDTIEPLPFDADQLLSSSFKYSEDLVIAGARETRWTGVEARGGGVIYECGSRGCSGEREAVAAGRELLVLRRNSNTVRALDPRTGVEKWNFSVSEHHLALSGTDCIGRPPPPTLAPDYTIAVAVPEGVVGVKTAGEPPVVVWQHKLEAPVASIWRLRGGTLQNIDVLWAATKSLTADAFVQITPPSLYIGLHEHQLYVQEGLLYTQKMSTAVASKPLPWKIKQSRPLLTGPETALSNLQDSDPNTLALITLYGNAGQGSNHGYFLYNDDTCDQSVQIAEEEPDILNLGSENQSEHHHIHVHVYSLWFWWKEVLLIAISSALLMNLMIWPRFFAPRLQPPSPLPMNQECIVVEKHYDRTPSNSSQSYVGRYETDFSPVRCLGRGGFGVVFEAKNNIDHCSYAVKRITLPRRESKRERVLREVRALAKLEHENIVRYFNAWLEEPPPMWQEERDAQWIRELDGVSVQMTEDYTSPKDNIESPSPLSPSSKSHSDSKNVVLNMNKCQWEKSIDTAMNGLDADKNEGTKRNRSLSCNDSLSITFEEPVKSYKKAIENSSDVTIDGTLPKNFSPSKHLGGGDNDDSFIVFAQPEDVNHNSKGLSVAIDNISKHGYDRTNDSVRTSQTKSEKKRKKGHARHWSLDMCVKSTEDRASNGGTKMYLYIQMQLCRRDSLHDWLRINRTFEARADLANSLFSQIVSAVEYVHLAGLIHRDLKPSNIFFAPDGKVKVGDFGLVTAMGDNTPEATPEAMDVQARHTYRVGTHLYMSPEQMEGRTYSYKVDIYSLGLILFELLYPFGTESERIDCLLQLRRGHYPKMFQNKHPNEMEVLKLMLSEEPTERPTASGVRARAPLYQCTDERYHFCLPQAI